MQFRHQMKLNSVRVGLILSLAFSLSAQAAEDVTKPLSSAEKAEATVKTICSACHGLDGNSVVTANPKL